MRYVGFVLLIFVVVISADSSFYDVNDAHNLFEKFIKDYDRQYIDEADRKIHYDAFVKKLDTINLMNKGSPETTFGITQFADYTDDEMQRLVNLQEQ